MPPASRLVAPFAAALLVLAACALFYLQSVHGLLAASQALGRHARLQAELAAAMTAPAPAEAQRHLQALRSLYAGDREALQRLALLAAPATDAAAAAARPRPFAALQAALNAHESEAQERLAAARGAMWQRLWALLVLMALMLLAAAAVAWRERRRHLRLAEQLRYEAMHDSLTGLPNRRFFNQWLERTLAQARREQRPLALLYLDLDGFRRVNDGLGHEIADRLLRVAARRFRDTLRESDVLARLGADEFVVLTAMTAAPENAAVLAERLIAALRTPLLPQFGEKYPVGVSVGVALYPGHAASPDGLLQAAEQAMQAAKQAGRNRHAFPAVVPSPAPANPASLGGSDSTAA